jgi:SAM-dependent methyltransferase
MTSDPALVAVARSLALHRTQLESFTRSATEWLVHEVGDARELLDLASGTGDPGLALAAAWPRARVLATDRAAELLTEAACEARARGLSNLHTLQADMHAMPLPAACVDGVTSRLGIQFARDARGVLAEILRLLRPGGNTCHVVWGAPAQPLLHAMGLDGAKLATGAPGPFQFSRPGSLAEALATAGFVDVEEQTLRHDWIWQGDARCFSQFMRETSGEALETDEARDASRARLEGFARSDTLVFPVEVHCARARKPASGSV